MALTVTVLGVSLLLAFVFYALPSGLGFAIVREHGAIEVPTALAFAAAAGAAIWIALRDRWRSGYAAAVILAAAAARELDFHRRFTTISVERGFYLGYLFLSPRDAPWPEKLAIGVVLALLVAAVSTLVVRERRAFVAGLRARHPSAVAVLGGRAGGCPGLRQGVEACGTGPTGTRALVEGHRGESGAAPTPFSSCSRC